MTAEFQHDIYLANERGLEASCTLVLCLSLAALGSDSVTSERRNPLDKRLTRAGQLLSPGEQPERDSP